MGVISISGVDKDGEIMYSISEKAKELAPELWQAHLDYIDEMLIDLFQKDLISITYNENLEAFFELTDEAKKILKEYGF